MSCCGAVSERIEIVGIAEAVHDPLALGLEQREIQGLDRRAGQAVGLVQGDLEEAGERGLDGGAGKLGIALRGMRIAGAEQGALDRDRVVHRAAPADPPVVDVAAEVAGRDRIDDVRLGRRHPHGAQMRPDRHAHALQHRHVLGDRAVVDRHARIVDDVVHHAERIGLRHPAVVVDRARPVPIAGGIDLVDGDHLAGLRLLDHVVVVEAPPRRGIAAEGLAGIGGVAARARRDVEDLDLEHVAGSAPHTKIGPVRMWTPKPSPAPRPYTDASIGPAPRRSTPLPSASQRNTLSAPGSPMTMRSASSLAWWVSVSSVTRSPEWT